MLLIIFFKQWGLYVDKWTKYGAKEKWITAKEKLYAKNIYFTFDVLWKMWILIRPWKLLRFYAIKIQCVMLLYKVHHPPNAIYVHHVLRR